MDKSNLFIKIPLWLLRQKGVSFGAKILYGRLSLYAGSKKSCYASISQLQKELGGISNKTVLRYIQELWDSKLIKIEKAFGKRSVYYILENEWCQNDTSVETTPPEDECAEGCQNDTSVETTQVEEGCQNDTSVETTPPNQCQNDTSVETTPPEVVSKRHDTPCQNDTSTSVKTTPPPCQNDIASHVKTTPNPCHNDTQKEEVKEERKEDIKEELKEERKEDVETDEHSSILNFPDSKSSDSDSKVPDENNLDHPYYKFICELVLQRLKMSSVARKPKWLKSEDPAVLVKKKRDMKNLLQWLKLNAEGLEKEYLWLTVLQIDPKMMGKDMSFLTSPNPRRAWENFLGQVEDYSKEKIIEIVDLMLQLYDEYRTFKIETLKQPPPLKCFKISTDGDGDPTSKYPEFDFLVNPSIEFCINQGVQPWQVVQGMYNEFLKIERNKGKNGDFKFTCAHVGSQYKPSWQTLKEIVKKKVNPWDEIIKFLGLSPNVKIAKRGIPLGFSLSGYDETHGVTMMDITEIDGNRYFLKNGTDHIARYYFSATDPFAFYVRPDNFQKFKELWNVDTMPLPSYEELQENGKDITRKQYDTWKVNQEDGSKKGG
jgi:hypothetical protein